MEFANCVCDDVKHLIEKKNFLYYLNDNEKNSFIELIRNKIITSKNRIIDFMSNSNNIKTLVIIVNMNNILKAKLKIEKSGEYTISIVFNQKGNVKNNGINLLKEFKREVGYVYYLKSERGWKIGKTKNLNNRRKIFEVKIPFEFEIIFFTKSVSYNTLEKELHTLLSEKNIEGEWFDLDNDDFVKIRHFLLEKDLKLSNYNY